MVFGVIPERHPDSLRNVGSAYLTDALDWDLGVEAENSIKKAAEPPT